MGIDFDLFNIVTTLICFYKVIFMLEFIGFCCRLLAMDIRHAFNAVTLDMCIMSAHKPHTPGTSC